MNIDIFTITDIHLGINNRTKKIADNLIKFFITNKKTLSVVSIIGIMGDLFEKLLASNSDDYRLAIRAITYIVQFCLKHNIKLRILEGTPSHDNRQMESISELINGIDKLDYKYVSTLDIEYIKDYNINILYLPDKYRETGEEIKEEIKLLLKEKGLSKVDLIFAHGQFPHQLPIESKSSLDTEYFLSIVKYYVIIGHIHMRSILKQIIAPGSFDRLEVNNEGPKGGAYLKIRETLDKSSYYFIDNHLAMRFDTIDYYKLTSKQIYKKIVKYIRDNGIDEYDHLRLKVDNRQIYFELEEALVKDGYKCTFGMYEPSTKKKIIESVKVMIDTDSFIEINENNIIKLLMDRKEIKDLSIVDKNKIKELVELMSK